MTGGGNQALLDRLVAERLPEALRFALRLTGCQETAEEVLQEALCRAVRAIGSFRGQSQFHTWFYRIIITTFHDHLAASARQGCSEKLTEELDDPRADNPPTAAMANELRDMIAQRISALPLRQREVLLLAAYERLRPSEIADMLGISEANVHTNLHYARTRLREELTPYLTEK
jgi:RNA polymerase sigma-70 factor, ECF subfamily